MKALFENSVNQSSIENLLAVNFFGKVLFPRKLIQARILTDAPPLFFIERLENLEQLVTPLVIRLCFRKCIGYVLIMALAKYYCIINK